LSLHREKASRNAVARNDGPVGGQENWRELKALAWITSTKGKLFSKDMS